jgi:NAD(P)-dependent dehydrogenase (short-subunit alcohol dehydrogenase family)
LNPTYDFRGQVAVVTGAASGMGRDTAHAFGAAGAAVVLAAVEAAQRCQRDVPLSWWGLVARARQNRVWGRAA